MVENENIDPQIPPVILFSYEELDELNKLDKVERYRLMKRLYMIRNFERIHKLGKLRKENESKKCVNIDCSQDNSSINNSIDKRK